MDESTIARELRAAFPTMHAFTAADGTIGIAGAFPVLGADGVELDRFHISIVLPCRFPNELPIVRELSGRIPRVEERHVEVDGTACVLFPDDRWRCFPPGSTLIDYIRGPLHNFFLSQLYYEEHSSWPFGEWAHGREGVLEYYRWFAGVDDDLAAYRFLFVLAKRRAKLHWDCPCGSGKKIKICCRSKISEMRSRIGTDVAEQSYERLGLVSPPYSGPRLKVTSAPERT